MEKLLQIGAISTTHGIRGEVKVFPMTDDINRFKNLKEIILDTGKEQLTLKIQSVKFFKKLVILKFKGIDDINEIEQYKGKGLYIERKHIGTLAKDEYFVKDIIGIQVMSDQDELLGHIVEVIETGANDVYVIETKIKTQLLVPAIKQCVKEIDILERRMIVHLMEGLR